MNETFIFRLFKHFCRFNLSKKRTLFKKVGVGCTAEYGLVLHHPEFISLGNHFFAQHNLCLETWPEFNGKRTGYKPELTIGNNVTMMANCQISCLNEITIGDNCLFGDNVLITDNFHGGSCPLECLIPPLDRQLVSKGPIHIGENVWIGRNVCIFSGVTIGSGAVIGANSVVTHDIPNSCVCAGAPAKIILHSSKMIKKNDDV
jgi:serine acetyltransferase